MNGKDTAAGVQNVTLKLWTKRYTGALFPASCSLWNLYLLSSGPSNSQMILFLL